MNIEGGATIDKCWASTRPGDMSEYAICDKPSGNDPLGLCNEHRQAIVPLAQPAVPALVVPSAL